MSRERTLIGRLTEYRSLRKAKQRNVNYRLTKLLDEGYSEDERLGKDSRLLMHFLMACLN